MRVKLITATIPGVNERRRHLPEAAWYWLEDETNGEPGIYLAGLFVLGCVVLVAMAAAIGVGTFGHFLTKMLSRRPRTTVETTASQARSIDTE